MSYIFKTQNWFNRLHRPSIHYQGFNQSLLFNLLAFLFIASVFMLIGWGGERANEPLSQLQLQPVTLDYHHLFEYSIRTSLRMFIGICASLIFSFAYAKLANSSIYLEQIMNPFLDILQSVPILGFISFTITLFLNLFPGSVIGVECAAIFAIFTSQAWNMTYSFLQSLKNLPTELNDVCSITEMSAWQKFWKFEVPFALPALVWNMAISISSAWFFVVASEVITVGNNKIALPGLGSYIGLAIQQGNIPAIIIAMLTIIFTIVMFDQIFLRPLLVWSEKYQYEGSSAQDSSSSIIYSLFQRDIWIKKIFLPIIWLGNYLLYLPILNHKKPNLIAKKEDSIIAPKLRVIEPIIWYLLLICFMIFLSYKIFIWLSVDIDFKEVIKVFFLTIMTFIRVMTMGVLVSIILVPLAIYIGLKPKLATFIQPILQILAAFPANLLFPIWAIMINHYSLNPNIWLSPLLMMGAQWYILFNIIAGALSFPQNLRDVVQDLKITGKVWWLKIMFPFILPYFMTGVIVAVGGAWNACIVAEYINYNNQIIVATGIGSYISEHTVQGDLRAIALGILMMVAFVVTLNRMVWMPLYNYSIKNSQL